MMGDKSRYEKEREVDTGPPTWEEMKKAAAMGKPEKAVNRSGIPSEVWRKSEFTEGVVEADEGDVGANERGIRG